MEELIDAFNKLTRLLVTQQAAGGCWEEVEEQHREFTELLHQAAGDEYIVKPMVLDVPSDKEPESGDRLGPVVDDAGKIYIRTVATRYTIGGANSIDFGVVVNKPEDLERISRTLNIELDSSSVQCVRVYPEEQFRNG